jgi:3-oxoacyl-[acyl-carrier-protein] synthase II
MKQNLKNRESKSIYMRVVITGMEAMTPLGLSAIESWSNLKNGVSGISEIKLFDPSPLKCRIAGELKDFNPENYIDKKMSRRLDRMQQLFQAVSVKSAFNAGLENFSPEDPYRFSVVGASALGTPSTYEHNIKLYSEGLYKKISPFFVVNMSANTSAGFVAEIFGAKGPQRFLMEACSSGVNALGIAYKMIKNNEIDLAIVTASEAGITPTIMAGLDRLGATVDDKWNLHPEKASRPFDAMRNGFVPAEGAGSVVLESHEHALRRGAKIYAEIAGFGSTCDAYHPTAQNPNAESVAKCMEIALKDAGISYEDIDFINAHGTSTPSNDVVETKGIKKVFKEKAYSIPITANKSMLGHMWAAAGIVETIFTVYSLIENIVPPVLNLENQDQECDLDYVRGECRVVKGKYAIKNSFGFGGNNGSLVLKAYSE